MTKLCVISACYEKPELAAILRESCAKYGLPLLMHCADVWPGSMRVGKLEAALHMLPEAHAAGATHVLWADAFDTFVCQPESVIMERFHKFDKPIVLSGEKNCWPDAAKAGEYPPSDSPWRFVNAGTWMGDLVYVEQAIETMLRWYPDEQDDQRMWTDYFLSKTITRPAFLFAIDTGCAIFQTMWGTELSEVRDPCVVHYNGGVWRNPADRRYIEHWERVRARGDKT